MYIVQWEPTVKDLLPDKTSLVVEEPVEDLVEPVTCPRRGAGEGETPCSFQIQMSEIFCSRTSEEEADQEA